MRQIVLDTETTGLEATEHYIIEIGCVELVNRRPTGNNYHQYIKPDREVDAGAFNVHGLTNEFLADKPRFRDVMDDLLAYLTGVDELIIHNAPFDIGFINMELQRSHSPVGDIQDLYAICDTLIMARRMHSGQKNSLDALCRRYRINNEHREFHGALLDATLLAEVYLAMTGGQVTLSLNDADSDVNQVVETEIRRLADERPRLKVVHASDEEIQAHTSRLKAIDKESEGGCLWLREDGLT